MPVVSVSTRHFLADASGSALVAPGSAGIASSALAPAIKTDTTATSGTANVASSALAPTVQTVATATPLSRVIVMPRRQRRARVRDNMVMVTSTGIDVTPAAGPVAFDAVGPSSAGASATGTNTASWSHTCTGTNRLLVVGVAVGNAPSTGISTSVTYNGVNMTSVAQMASNNSTDGYVELFRLIAPATGANTVVVTTSSSIDAISAGSVSFTGVSQTSPLGTAVTAFGSGTTPSAAVTGTTSGNMVIDAVCTGAGVLSSTQTNRWLRNTSIASAGGNGASSTASAGGTVTMSYSVTNDWWGLVAVEVKQG